MHLPRADADKALIAFGTSGAASLSDPDGQGHPKDGAIGLKTGKPHVDSLLSWMLQGDADKRPTAKQVLAHHAFNRIGVGGPEAKQLLVALMHDDNTEIAKARQDLRRVRIEAAIDRSIFAGHPIAIRLKRAL